MRSAIGLPSVRPCRTPDVTSARSVSIFIRPPRPCPSWRRARSRSRSSGLSSSPAGRPSTTAVRPGPCDSPAVVKRSAIGRLPYRRSRALLRSLADAADVEHAPDEVARVARALAERNAGALGGLVALQLVVGDELAVHLQE